MLDSSVNEISVHWCGSSEQHFYHEAPFLGFNQLFFIYNRKYIEAVERVVSTKCPETLGLTIFKEMIQADLDFLNTRLVKPFTSKQILSDCVSKMKNKIENQPELQIFSE